MTMWYRKVIILLIICCLISATLFNFKSASVRSAILRYNRTAQVVNETEPNPKRSSADPGLRISFIRDDDLFRSVSPDVYFKATPGRQVPLPVMRTPEEEATNGSGEMDQPLSNIPMDGSLVPESEKEKWKAPPIRLAEAYEKYGGDDAADVCVPMAKWHSQTFPTCNMFHEADMLKGIVKKKRSGHYRDVWQFYYSSDYADYTDEAWGQIVAFKTIRLNIVLSFHRMEQQRIDALVAERLTNSPQVIDVYGYCGFSTMNTMLAGGFGEEVKHMDLTWIQKLSYARDMAESLADAHNVDGGDGMNATIIHRDVRSANFLLSHDGKVVLHDFNLSRFPTWNKEKGEPCGFLKPECTEFKAPEECLGKPLDEKIDIYALGNVFYYLLTKHRPYFWPKRFKLEKIQKYIVRGMPPPVPREIEESKDLAIRAIYAAMRKCHAYDPKERPTARELANALDDVIIKLSTFLDEMRKKHKGKGK